MKFLPKLRNMTVFIQKMNRVKGENDWIVENEDYDYHQEVARASFADMLHDTERNKLYEKALKHAIIEMHSRGKKANVLDIGTGTGLLSMMAVRNGADSVIACEGFKPMSDCALKIISLNKLEDKISIIPKRSTHLTVGEYGDLKQRCNILVTEVFDTELIGEGALSTFKHAHIHLLEHDCIVVPHAATIFAQVVECPIAQNWNKLKNIFNDDGEILIQVPESIKKCPGSAAVHDIQLSQLPISSVNTIVSPLPVLRFDWTGRMPIIFERTINHTVKAERDGIAQAVFMWWELQMDMRAEIILSCAPWWAHPYKKIKPNYEVPWRDHWMQAVYYLPKEMPIKSGQEINLITCHDEYSLWFNLVQDFKLLEKHYQSPICDCGLHVTFSHTRIGQMNDFGRNKKYLALLEKNINENSVGIVVGDGFYYSLVSAKLGAKTMYYLENNHLSRQILQDFVKCNNLNNIEVIPSLEKLKEIDMKSVNIVIGEPYFLTSLLPWDNLLFLYVLKGLRTFLESNVKIFPQRAIVKAVAVHFKDLYKIRSPVTSCEGFLMEDFDALIEKSSNISDDNVEAQPLWEYPCTALSREVDIIDLDLIEITEGILESKGSFDLESGTDCNGIALWVEWNLDTSSGATISTGPIMPIEIGQQVHWNMHTRQGVYLFPNKSTRSIKYNFTFDVNDGNISFTCK